MKYRYLIGIVNESKYGSKMGNVIIERDKRIKTEKDIEEVEEFIKKDLDSNKIILISFSELEVINDDRAE